jgi:hypothetical protein
VPLEGGSAAVNSGLLAAFRGYVIVYDADRLIPLGCFSPIGLEGNTGVGIWQSGRAPVIDGEGYVYYLTGNELQQEPIAPNPCAALGLPWQHMSGLANSLIKLDVRSGISLADHAAPKRYRQALDDCDMDLSGSGPLLIPGTSALLAGGKQGFLHVFDKKGGKYTEISSRQVYDGPVEKYYDENGHRTAIPCLFHGEHHLMGGPVYWESASKGRLIYVSAETDAIKAFKFETAGPIFLAYDDDLLILNRTLPLVMRTSQQVLGHPAAILSLSANGNKEGTGVLWAAHADRKSQPADPFYTLEPGVLRAYDAENLSRELWNSNMCAADLLGNFAKFTPPTVANGKVYMATFSGKLVVYGLLPRPRSCN